MEILVFLLLAWSAGLVQGEDNLAMESSLSYQETYKVRPDPEDLGRPNERQVEGYLPVGHVHSEGLESPLEEHQGARQNQIRGPVEKLPHPDDAHDVRLVAREHSLQYLPGDLRAESPEGHQEAPQEIYLQQYSDRPVHVFGGEASPLRQINERGPHGQKTLGFSSFVEHVTAKEEEEIDSALKEGAVGDLKRLVPKSGISFKIYQADKGGDLHSGSLRSAAAGDLSKAQEAVREISAGVKVEVPETPFRIQAVHHEYPNPAKESPQVYLSNHVADQHFENSQQSFQAVGKVPRVQEAQHANVHGYYSRQEESAGKGASVLPPRFKIQVQDDVYNKPTSTIEFNRNVNSLTTVKSPKVRKGFAHHQRHWNSPAGRVEGLHQSAKQLSLPAKPLESLQYQVNPLPPVEETKIAQNDLSSHAVVGHSAANSHLQIPAGNLNGFVGHSQVSLDAGKASLKGFAGQTAYAEAAKVGQQILVNRLTGTPYASLEGLTTDRGHSFGDSQPPKTTHDNLATQLRATSLSDSEAAKSSHYNVVGHVEGNAYVDAKVSQNNFDHQKALEGSTSFDIKNAIGNAEGLPHQTVDVRQQHLAYVLPKIPATAATGLLLHESPGVALDHLVHSPQVPHHGLPSPVVSEVSGKYFGQPQAISWGGEPLKQGNVLTANDLHRSVIRLHVPKEELVHHAKSQSLDVPAGFVLQNSFGHHGHQFAAFREGPRGKFHEVHFQPKKQVPLQGVRFGHPKGGLPVAVDWSLFKTQLSHLNANAAPDVLAHVQESGKKIIPILVKKRKNRSSKDAAVVYGKVVGDRRPKQPSQCNEKNVHFNLLPEASNVLNRFHSKGDRKNEFSVSASYKVDRSFKVPDSS